MERGEIARRLQSGEVKITFARKDATDSSELQPFVDRVIEVVKEVAGIGSVWVSDESCLSDFGISGKDFDEIGRKLGIDLVWANDDDQFIVRIAKRLKDKGQT